MAKAKKRAGKSTTKAAPAPTTPKAYASAADFIRSQPITMKAPDVVKLGEQQGVKVTLTNVRQVRHHMKHPGAGRARKGESGASAPASGGFFPQPTPELRQAIALARAGAQQAVHQKAPAAYDAEAREVWLGLGALVHSEDRQMRRLGKLLTKAILDTIPG